MEEIFNKIKIVKDLHEKILSYLCIEDEKLKKLEEYVHEIDKECNSGDADKYEIKCDGCSDIIEIEEWETGPDSYGDNEELKNELLEIISELKSVNLSQKNMISKNMKKMVKIIKNFNKYFEYILLDCMVECDKCGESTYDYTTIDNKNLKKKLKKIYNDIKKTCIN